MVPTFTAAVCVVVLPPEATIKVLVLLPLGGDVVVGITVDESAVLLVTLEDAVDEAAEEEDVGEPTVDDAADETAESCCSDPPIPVWLLPLLLLSATIIDDSLLSLPMLFVEVSPVFNTSCAIVVDAGYGA